MAKRFDATLKQLVEARPADWLALAGFPTAGTVRLVDADVSAITASADKVMHVAGPPPYLGHTEFQAGPDSGLDFRVLLYQVLLRSRHALPVRSVVFLLHPRAATGVTGRIRYEMGVGEFLNFSYRVVRVWELPVEQVLAGGIGTLPLAPISAIADDDVGDVVERMRDRFAEAAVASEMADIGWAATYILGGLRYDEEFLEDMLKGVWNMEESVTYQALMKRGLAKGFNQGITQGITQGLTQGRLEEARDLVTMLASKKFGPPDERMREQLEALTDLDDVEAVASRLLTATDWPELLASAR